MTTLTARLSALREPFGRRLRVAVTWIAARPRVASVAVAALALTLMGAALLRSARLGGTLSVVVRRGDLVVRLTETGILKPAESITYRSPLGGREAEVVLLVPEGTLVGEGDLLARLDTTDLKRELERAVPEYRQAQVDLKLAEADIQEGLANVDSQQQGEGALGVDEARSNLRLAEKKVARLKDEYEKLKPLMEKGFITHEELERSAFELEQAEAELALARRKADVYIQQTHPRGEQRARLQLAQKEAQLANVRARTAEAEAHVRALREAIEGCSIYARRPGLVVYEEFLATSPRRKVRVGDRVTGSQGLLTIPEVKRMVVEASVDEFDVHRVRPGQPATIRLDAFPDLRLKGKVGRVGTLARASAERPSEGKRFDLLVEIDPSEADLRPEMTARVDVLVGERKGVLLVPVNALFEREGVTVAHVLRAFSIETRQVQLGDSTELYAEVLAGLRESDRVALVDIASAGAVRKPTGGEGPPAPMQQTVPEGKAAPLAPH